MNTRKRTLDQTEMLQANLETLVDHNKKLCSLLSEILTSLNNIEQAVVVIKTAKQTIHFAQPMTIAEDSNSMPPPVPHLPFPDDKFK